MKKIATLLLLSSVTILQTNGQVFSDDFESYTIGIALGPQSPNWATWTGAGGGADDVNVSNSDNNTSGGSKSLYFSSTSASGGPEDVVLPFSTSPLTSGFFSYSTWLKIPAGKSSYFNFQGTPTMGGLYTFECFMRGGFLDIMDGGSAIASTTYPFDTWFEIKIEANLSTGNWELFKNGTSAATWMNAVNQIYAIDIFPADDTASFWVDDVSFFVSAVGINENSVSQLNVDLFPNPASENVTVVVNLEQEAKVNIAVYTIQGALISNQAFGTLSGKQNLGIDISEFASGMYFVEVNSDGKKAIKKLTKK